MEGKIKLLIGELYVQVLALQTQLEAAKQKIAELEQQAKSAEG